MVSSFKQPSHVGVLKRHTKNYDLEVPYFDTPGWGQYVEEDLDTIDALIFAMGGMVNVKGVWENGVAYVAGDRLVDPDDGIIYQCLISHTSATTGTFAQDRAAHPTYWMLMQVGWNYRGAWAPATKYYKGDVVYDANEHVSAVASVDHTSTSNIRSDAANWNFIVDLDATVDEATSAAAAASDSASAAATSATNAATSASQALTQANNAAISASAAAGSATSALTSANGAASSASQAEDAQIDAETAATAAANSASAAANAENNALFIYDAFDDRYLGSKPSDPSTDNDGNALLDGAMYWNNALALLRVYDQNTDTWNTTSGEGVGEAPIDGEQYARQNGGWEQVDIPPWNGGEVTNDIDIRTVAPELRLKGTAANDTGFVQYYLQDVLRWNVGMNAAQQFEIGRFNASGVYQDSTIIDANNGAFVVGGAFVVNRGQPVVGLNRPDVTAPAQIASQVNWTDRWIVTLGNTETEGGGPTGSDGNNFEINAYKNDGSWVGTALKITRSSLAAVLGGSLIIRRSGGASIVMDNPGPGLFGNINWRVNDVQRWVMGIENDAESGGNAGATFSLRRYADNGAFIDFPVKVDRATGTMTLANPLAIGPTVQPTIALQRTGTTGMAGFASYSDGKLRWHLRMPENTAESGSNAGSNFNIGRYNDAGALIDLPVTISRATGQLYLTQALQLTNGQIIFPATQVPSANANTLDDYAEGSWTPTLTFGGASVGITYSLQRGYYRKIGSMVTVWGEITTTSKGTSTGVAALTGLPYGVASIVVTGQLYLSAASLPSGSAPVGVFSGSQVSMQNQLITGVTNMSDAHLVNSSTIRVSASYLAAN